MESFTFNPFEDRLSRDIRNDMSETIIDVLADRSLEKARVVAQSYLQDSPARAYREYIDGRLKSYGRALALITPDTSLLHQAAVLWNLQLQFEVHEILEPEWMIATGNRKLILQALIRSAGVYINMELGYRDRAAKIASKALPVLVELKAEVADEIEVDKLISALKELPPSPPQILLL